MAKIYLAMYNATKSLDNYCTMPPFYETFIKGLKEAGNELMIYFTKDWGKNFTKQIPKDVYEQLKQFDADCYIFFNNCFWDISKLTDKPIIIYDVDSPMYYKNLDEIKNNPSRYQYMTIQNGSVETLSEYFNVPKSEVCYIPPFTGIHCDDSITMEHNISFVGTNWGNNGFRLISDFLKTNPSKEKVSKFKEAYNRYSLNPFQTDEEIYDGEAVAPISSYPGSASYISGIRRLQYLDMIADLGLDLHGANWDTSDMGLFPELAFSYNNKPIYSLQDNEDLYNRSKIGFNINHIQAVSGFSWRVSDIMASNACVVTEFKPDMKEAFAGVNIPTFTNKYEAREICKKLLESEEERREIVCASHELIERKYRFETPLCIMEEFLKMNLHSSGNYEPQYVYDDSEKKAFTQQNYPTEVIIPKYKAPIVYRVFRKTHRILDRLLRKKGYI